VIGSLSTRESRAALRGAELLAHQATDAASRAEAEHGLELARREQVRVPVLAPTSGTVVRRAAEPGAEMAEGAELLAIVHDDGRVFEAHVAAANAARVRPGEVARVEMDGASPVNAVVQRRLPGVSPEDQSMLVWLTPRSALPATAIGRFGTARIEVGAPRSAIAVPDSALVEDDLTGELRVARVEANGIAVWTTVQVGRAGDGCHELLSPKLPAGTVVVVDGQRGLPDSVSVVPR
jgi:multidrug efflux pump subunit AcrA (membrane-fusion protein)